MTELLAPSAYVFADVRATEREPVTRASFEVSSTASVPSALLANARSEAMAAGYAAGWAQGMSGATAAMAADVTRSAQRAAELDAERRAALQTALGALDRAVATLEAQAVPAAAEIEETLLSLGIALAEGLLQHELRLSGSVARDALARVLQLAPAGERVVVRLSPADHAVLQAEDLTALQGERVIVLQADPTLSRGDAVATCGVTEIDARLSAGLERIKAVLAA